MKKSDSRRVRGINEFYALLFFLLLVTIFFAPVLFGGATLLPFDNLYRYPPWHSFATTYSVTQPHNTLLDDLVLENYPWKKFILDSVRQGELPLWNPYILAGQPFLAAGQNAALYPLGLLFYILPLTQAYGVFAALHFWIAAAGMYFLARVLRLRPFAAIVSGVVYAFSGFMVVSVVFPMVISAAAWLPAILATVELTLREEEKRRADKTAYSFSRELFFALVTAVLLGLQFLAGHVEMSYYILLVLAFYAAWRVVQMTMDRGPRTEISAAPSVIPHPSSAGARRLFGQMVRLGAVLAAIVVLGFALAGVQIIPLYELVQRNFRAGSVSYDQVAGWALPIRQVFTFFIPDLFGNPAHHSYLDVFDWTTHAAPAGTIFWGVKNYVESGSYVGLLPLALALIAVVSCITYYVLRITNPASRPTSHALPYSHTHVLLFTVLALLSLLFAFGTPLYAVLFYTLPGYNQLHTAFRWIFPYTLSLAFLAGAGADLLPSLVTRGKSWEWGDRLLVAAGLAIVVVLGTSLVWGAPFVRLSDWLLAHSDLARTTFDSGRMFWSYEFRNLLIFGLFLAGTGMVLHIARSPRCLPQWLGGGPVWQPLALGVIALDLFIFGFDFNPRANPQLVQFTPPAIQFLQNDRSLFRITSYDVPNGDDSSIVFNANTGMYFGLQDIRGYDSIIPKQYADFMGLLAPQEELLYNRIAAFYDYQPLSSPLLNLLNVKYVLTTRAVPNPGYKLAYDGEIKIYENVRVLPRAFMVAQSRVIPDRAELLQALGSFDPAREVLLEENAPRPGDDSDAPLPTPAIEKYSGSEVLVKSNASRAAYLVLADSYFPGWIAQIDGQDVRLYRADYNFRAVVVPAGAHTIRFKYSPLSFKVGGVTSLVAGMLVLLGLVTLGWRRFAFTETSGEGAQVRVIAKNSVVPMAASFLMQGLNLALTLVVLRVLGPTDAGRYAFAVTTWLFVSSITDFGLGILMTREVSRDRTLANRYLTNTAVLRTWLTLVAIFPLGLILYAWMNYAGYVHLESLAPNTVVAILLLWVSLIPNNLAASFSYLFNAYERFEYPTAVQLATVLLSIALQLAALLSGFGIIGLAAVSILTNLFTLAVQYYLVRTVLFQPRWEFDGQLMRWMFFESYPLMMNNVLASLFFRIDVFILQPLRGDTVLGYYTTAYKYINALNFIPSNFTLAIFPMLSRFASSAKDAMYRALIVSLKLLLWVSLPITIASVFLARELILFFGGSAYLPDSQIALQWLIWFLPFSFVNSVVHYVLIALNQQRFLTKAFLIGLGFNILANWLAIQALSYRGAALITVLSEIVLLLPFYYSLRNHLAPLPVLDILWRPVIAAAAMAGALYVLLPLIHFILALAAASLLYGILLLVLGAVGPDEWLLIQRLVPHRFERVVLLIGRLTPQQKNGPDKK